MPPPSDISTAEIGGLIYPSTQIDAGNNINLWQTMWTISNNDVLLNGISFREVGSVGSSDINNFRLYVDGTQIGSAVQSVDSNGYIIFTLSERLSVGSRVIKLVGDVIGGQRKTFSFSLWLKNDVQLVDTKYNKSIEPLSILQGTPMSQVNSGSVTLTKTADSPFKNVNLGATDVILGRFQLTAHSEPMRIYGLTLSFQTNSSVLNVLSNVEIYLDGKPVSVTRNLFKNGQNMDSTKADYDPSQGLYNFTGINIFNPNSQHIIEIYGDISSTSVSSMSAGDTIQVVIKSTAGTNHSCNATGQSSLSCANVPVAPVYGNILTVTD